MRLPRRYLPIRRSVGACWLTERAASTCARHRLPCPAVNLPDLRPAALDCCSFITGDGGRTACPPSRRPRPDYACSLCPTSPQGLEAALAAGAREVAIFTAASEAFNHRNLNCSVDESLAKFDSMVAVAKAEGVAVRGYVSCVVGCPIQVGTLPSVVRQARRPRCPAGREECMQWRCIGPTKAEPVQVARPHPSRRRPPAAAG